MNYDIKGQIDIVSFTYMQLDQLPLLEEIFSSNKHGIHDIHDRYVLLSYDDNKSHHDCPIIEILKNDIERSDKKWIKKYYNDLITKFGKEIVDLLIIEDESIIRNKIIHILNFAMDKLYKSPTLKIEMNKYQYSPKEQTSIPDLIYSTLGANFDIIDQYLLGKENYIIIKRRK